MREAYYENRIYRSGEFRQCNSKEIDSRGCRPHGLEQDKGKGLCPGFSHCRKPGSMAKELFAMTYSDKLEDLDFSALYLVMKKF